VDRGGEPHAGLEVKGARQRDVLPAAPHRLVADGARAHSRRSGRRDGRDNGPQVRGRKRAAPVRRLTARPGDALILRSGATLYIRVFHQLTVPTFL